MPLGRLLGMSPDSSLCPTGLPRTLKILLLGLPCPAFSMFEMTMRAVLLELLEISGALELDVVSGATELDENCSGSLDELETGSEQFSPMQNVSVSPGVPMSAFEERVRRASWIRPLVGLDVA